MRLLRESNREPVELTEQHLLGAGGEARIYRIPGEPSLVAKIWHQPTVERSRKLRAMLANPPLDPTAGLRHISIAWPTDTLLAPEAKPRPVGFTMPYVAAMSPVIDFFNPKTRRQKCPLFSFFYLMRTGRNLAIAVRALHERGYVIGDMNESNILVSETALVTIVDTDSFQVWDPEQGMNYRCRVGKPEFTPPEIQGKRFAQFDREKEHDLFGLGIIIFQLLMEGTHPFAGTFMGQGEPAPHEERILKGHFPHGNDPAVPYGPKPAAPPFQMLPPALQHLFIRCFQDGHRDPAARPDTQSWQWALDEAEASLIACPVNAQHVYSNHLSACPWCERTAALGGRDPFPSAEAVRQGVHLRPPVRAKKRALARPAPLPRLQTPPRHLTVPPLGANPPLPKPIPPRTYVRPRRSKKTYTTPPFWWPAPRNDWAWISIFFAALALASGVLTVFFTAAFGMLAILCGIYGEIQANGWELDGKGRWMARTGWILGIVCLAVFAFQLSSLKPN